MSKGTKIIDPKGTKAISYKEKRERNRRIYRRSQELIGRAISKGEDPNDRGYTMERYTTIASEYSISWQSVQRILGKFNRQANQ